MNVRLKASVNMKDDIYAKIKMRSFFTGTEFYIFKLHHYNKKGSV